MVYTVVVGFFFFVLWIDFSSKKRSLGVTPTWLHILSIIFYLRQNLWPLQHQQPVYYVQQYIKLFIILYGRFSVLPVLWRAPCAHSHTHSHIGNAEWPSHVLACAWKVGQKQRGNTEELHWLKLKIWSSGAMLLSAQSCQTCLPIIPVTQRTIWMAW